MIVLLVLFEGAQYSKSLIAPAEEVLLSASPLTNREIYLFNWLSHFVIFSIPNYIFVLLGVISFFVVFDEVGFLFYLLHFLFYNSNFNFFYCICSFVQVVSESG